MNETDKAILESSIKKLGSGYKLIQYLNDHHQYRKRYYSSYLTYWMKTAKSLPVDVRIILTKLLHH